MALTSTNEDNNDKEQPKTKKHISKSRIYIYILKTEKKTQSQIVHVCFVLC